MAGRKIHQTKTDGGTLIQFNLFGLIFFAVSLVAVSSLLTYNLTSARSRSASSDKPAPTQAATTTSQKPPPWGELLLSNIELERPEEYIGFETCSNQPPRWLFENMTPDQVRQTLQACGLTSNQIHEAFLPEDVSVISSNTIIKPEDDLILSLATETRTKLYRQLALSPENHYMHYPFCFPEKSFETLAEDSKLNLATLAEIRQLLYPRGTAQCFSDYEMVERHLTSEEDRIRLAQALSRQSAVLARLQIRPETDIDKLLGYWSAPGVRVKDTRPLLESLQRLPGGGTISLLYLLPPFARQRLYTFPMPSKAGDSRMDCHWSTMNFFNETPDNRFSDSTYIAQQLDKNYYLVATPSAYGDTIFLLDENNNALHSAVYIADDLVFTKNGDNFLQPWMLMHLKDLLATYNNDKTIHVAVYRSKHS